MKKCSTCQEEKEDLDFYQAGPHRGLRPNCKECHKKLMRPRSRAHYLKNRSYYLIRNRRRRKKIAEYIQKLKETPCADCNIKYPYWVMQFDHVRGTKTFNVASMVSLESKRLIDEEVSKCEVVCANCHANRTFIRIKSRRRPTAST